MRWQKIVPTFLLALVLIQSGIIFFLLADEQVSTETIDRDRVATSEQISKASAETEKYSGGLLKDLIDVRLSIFKTTLAMLDQKRESFIRRVNLNFMVEFKATKEASDSELRLIIDEIHQAEDRVRASQKEASQYTGGLLQSLALMKAATDEISESQLRWKFYAAKYGLPMIPFKLPDAKGETQKSPQPPGTIVKDRDAL